MSYLGGEFIMDFVSSEIMQHIDLVVDYYVVFGWVVPYGTHVIWGQHFDLVLDYYVLLGWRVPDGTLYHLRTTY